MHKLDGKQKIVLPSVFASSCAPAISVNELLNVFYIK